MQKHLVRVEYEGASPLQGRVNRIPEWDKWTMEQKVAFLRSFVQDTARDPAIALKATTILRAAGVDQRDYRGSWAALLRWVQRNYRFTAEPNERIQSPQYTLSTLYGDCDDGSVLLAALGHSIRLPFRFVVSGRGDKGDRIRWVEGTGPAPKGVTWSHIYILAQWPPFKPRHAAWAEVTLDARLGWDSMKEPPPKNRADLAGERGGGKLGQTGARPPSQDTAPTAPVVQKAAARVTAVAKALPWITIAGSVVGSLLSFLLIQGVVIPRMRRQLTQRAATR